MLKTLRNLIIIILFPTLLGCNQKSITDEPPVFKAFLSSMVPSDSLTMRWSPKAEALPLLPVDAGLEASLSLGPEGTTGINVRLERSPGQTFYDRMLLDLDRNGVFDEEALTTTPSEIRHRMWSSFETVIDIPFKDQDAQELVSIPYGLSLWYVVDPREEEEAPVLRYTRTGWMQGEVTIGTTTAHILLTESKVDGDFTEEDSWALALPDSVAKLRHHSYARSAQEHAWLGEKAFKLVHIEHSGRYLEVAPFDPGMTRAEEIAINDKLVIDRQAPRSGRSVAFEHDFAAASVQARSENKLLFIDFETTWCGPCKTMDQWVYTADTVVEATNHLIAVKVDGDDFPELAERFSVTAYPTMLIVESNDGVIRRREGYQGVLEMTEFLSGSLDTDLTE